MTKLYYHDLVKQLQKEPHLTPEETLTDLRKWIDEIDKKYNAIPLGLLQAYTYILTMMKKEKE